MRRLAAVLIALTTLSACSGGERVAVRPPPEPSFQGPPPEPPRPGMPVRTSPIPTPPEPVAVAPEVQPRAPRGTVQSRAHYAEADVTEWTLTNGATVVFKPLPNGGRVERVVAPEECRFLDERPPDGLAGLFDAFYGSSSVYVLVGDARPGEVEQAAARLNGMPTMTVDCVRSATEQTAFRVALEPADDATLAVLVEVLRGRGQAAFARTSYARTVLGGATEALASLRPTDAELSAARSAAARRPEEAAFWLDALSSLYTAPGTVRPPRDPSLVARFPARVARVSSRAVADLAARFAASPAN